MKLRCSWGEFVLGVEVSRCKGVVGEFVGESTGDALVTQEGAVDSAEMQKGSPRRKTHV